MKPVEIVGTVHAITPELPAGNSGKMKRILVIKTDSQRNNLVPIECFGDRSADIDDLKVGDQIKAKAYIGGREYNGKFYADIQLAGPPEVLASASAEPDAGAGAVGDDSGLPF